MKFNFKVLTSPLWSVIMAEQRWCVSVPSRKAKGIKDDLRSRGWLDRTLKVLIRYALRRCVRGKGRGCHIGPWSN